MDSTHDEIISASIMAFNNSQCFDIYLELNSKFATIFHFSSYANLCYDPFNRASFLNGVVSFDDVDDSVYS